MTPATTTTHHQTLGRATRSEWIKLRTLGSTWIGMGAVVLLLVGLGAIAAAVSTGSVTTQEDGGGFGNRDPLSTVLTGADFAVLLVGVLGALAGAREYGSRMISATVAAVPRRWQVLVSKIIVLTGVVLPTALIGVLAAFGVGMGILSAGNGATVALTDDDVLRSVLGMAGYLTAIALMGLGLGVLLRSAASSIGVLIGGVLVLPALAGALLPASLDSVLQFLPSSAAAAFTTVIGAGAKFSALPPEPWSSRLGSPLSSAPPSWRSPSRRLSLNPPMLALRLPASPGGRLVLSAEAADLLDAPIGNCQEPLTCEDRNAYVETRAVGIWRLDQGEDWVLRPSSRPGAPERPGAAGPARVRWR